MKKSSFSPSDFHRRLMAENVPKLQFDGGTVARWQLRLRKKLRELVGEIPQERGPLRPRSLWKRAHPLGSIEKIIFTAEPGADVPAYVCLPKGVNPPYTFAICLQGHSTGMHNAIGVNRDDETVSIEVEGNRDFALQCMRHGLAALCIEQRSFGERSERRQIHAGQGCHDAVLHSLMLGRTLTAERVFDVDRGIDYLEQRGDADKKRIGVMGDSGGGTISMFAAALLPRLAFAMPACSFCTFEASIMSIFHCSDNYIPRLLQYAEMADIMGLFCPKPVVVVAGREDPIFPIKATRQAFRALQRIYRAAKAEDRCHLVIGNGGHRFYPEEAWPVLMKALADSAKRYS